MRIQTHTESNCQVVAISGSADVNASAVLREALLGAIASGSTRLICDLTDTDFICSDSLGVLITAYLKATGRGGFVRLAHPQTHLIEVLETTRLNRLFDVFPSVSCALAGSV